MYISGIWVIAVNGRLMMHPFEERLNCRNLLMLMVREVLVLI